MKGARLSRPAQARTRFRGKRGLFMEVREKDLFLSEGVIANAAVMPSRSFTWRCGSARLRAEPARVAPLVLHILDFDQNAVLSLFQAERNKVLVDFAGAPDPLVVNQCSVHPDFDSVVAADAEQGVRFVWHVDFGPGVANAIVAIVETVGEIHVTSVRRDLLPSADSSVDCLSISRGRLNAASSGGVEPVRVERIYL